MTTSTLSAGSHDITASYSGDSSYGATDSTVLTQVVNSAQPPTTVATLAPPANSAGWNHTPVTVTLTATPSSGGAPVAATYYGIDKPACAPTALATCSTYSAPFSVATSGIHTLTFFSVDTLGTFESAHSRTIKIDLATPSLTVTASAGKPEPHRPVFTVQGTAFFLTEHGAPVGTTSATCFDTRGLHLKLVGSDGGSGVAAVTYSATGAQHIASKTVAGGSATLSITSHGLTTLTASAKDASGNSSSAQRWAVAADSTDGRFSCAMPLGSLSLPRHGRIFVLGLVAVSPGFHLPIAITFRY